MIDSKSEKLVDPESNILNFPPERDARLIHRDLDIELELAKVRDQSETARYRSLSQQLLITGAINFSLVLFISILFSLWVFIFVEDLTITSISLLSLFVVGAAITYAGIGYSELNRRRNEYSKIIALDAYQAELRLYQNSGYSSEPPVLKG